MNMCAWWMPSVSANVNVNNEEFRPAEFANVNQQNIEDGLKHDIRLMMAMTMTITTAIYYHAAMFACKQKYICFEYVLKHCV